MVASFIPTNEAYSYNATGNGQEAMRWVDSDGSGTGQILRLTNRYLWADSVDQLLSDEQYLNNTGIAINATTSSTVAGNTLWTLGDHLGSIRDLLDNYGVIREHQVFDSYGRLVREVDYNSAGQVIASNDAWAVDTVFGYTGRSWDTDVNLQYNRARWYDPQTGLWLSQDPIGFAGGDENLYRYVGNGPTNATDPSGLQDPAIEKAKRREELRRRMREEMEEKGVGESEIRLRLAVIESLMQSRITESGNTRDSFWKENKKGYYVPNGDAVDAIRYLTRNPYNRVMCNKYSSIILIQGYIRYFEEMKDREIGDRGLEGLRIGLNEKVIPEDLPGEGNGIFFVELKGLIPHSSLLPGDQVWFQNPYNTGKFKTLGEEGSNIFYVGDGMVMQLYGNRSTFKIEDYPEQCMSDWRSISNRQKVDFSKIQIMGVRRPIAPPEDSEP